MNFLSLFLYLSDVLSNVQGILIAIILLIVVFNVFAYIITDEPLKHWYSMMWIAIVLTFTAALIPSKNTMYAIAASEMGERVIKSDSVQGLTSDATKALQLWIKRQIESEKK